MLQMLARNWWVVALRGVFAIIFGVLALIWPALTLVALVALFGAYALVDGVLSVITGIASRRQTDRWWAEVLEGIVGIVLGILVFVWPGVTAFVLLYLIAAWAIVTGIFEIIAAIRLRREIRGEWFMILSGVLSIVFGVLLILFPGAGALSVIWLIGAYSIIFGIFLIALSLRLRKARGEDTGGSQRTVTP